MTFLCPFTDITICNNIPFTNYNNLWLGNTGYLDGVKPSDAIFNTSPVVKFIDEYDRSAIAIKYSVQCPESEEKEYAVVAFQRYTGSKDNWVYGGHFARDGATSVGSVNKTWAQNLIQNKHESFPISDSEEVCLVSISDYNNFICPFTDTTTCNNIPFTNYNNLWLGNTGYLDGVKPSDPVFNTSPVVKFIDEYDRSAIAIKYSVQCPESEEKEYAVVAFQRYTDSKDNWVYGGHFARDGATSVGSVNKTWAQNLIQDKHESFPIYNSEEVCLVSISGITDTLEIAQEL